MVTGRIFAVKRFEIHDGDGIRTTLFLQGCSLHCLWCHNPEGLSLTPVLGFYQEKCINCQICKQVCPASVHVWENNRHLIKREDCLHCGQCVKICPQSALKLYGQEIAADEILPILLEDRMFYGNAGGITLSGGEPLLQKAFCLELLQKIKKAGIRTAVDTCGMVPKSTLEAIIPWVDQFLFDIKAVDPLVHERLTGRSNEQILKNLFFLNTAGVRIEVRVPFIPHCNEDEMEKIGLLLKKYPCVEKVKVLGFHNLARDKYRALDMNYPMGNAAPATNDEINRTIRLFRKLGLHAVR